MGRELPIEPKQGMEICFDLNVTYSLQQKRKKERKKGGNGNRELK